MVAQHSAEPLDTSVPAPTLHSGSRPVTVALVGAGDRGQVYSSWIRKHPERARLVAVCDPLEYRRDLVSSGDAEAVHFESWQDLANQPRLADMVIIATQDSEHSEPTAAFARLGYAIMLEKPIAPTAAQCRDIIKTVLDTNIMFGVCHVLRYAPYTNMVKSVVDSGELGQIMDISHIEPVGWWHMAHSYVRGNWRKEEDSSSMLLAKSCHDIDWIRYIAGQPIEKVASFGALTHFKQENKPAEAGAATRCLECPIRTTCPYSAPNIYLESYAKNGLTWPVSVITKTDSDAGVIQALETGPYGQCVYECDNDVVDHQSVLMSLAGGITATFTMTAFSEQTHRQTKIFGTHGYLDCDGESIRVVDFRTGKSRLDHVGNHGGSNAAEGHGGGDAGLLSAFVQAVATGDQGQIRSGAIESLESHLAVFAAEESRHSGQVHTVSTQ